MPQKQKNWYVLTGGPSAGKTTLLQFLEKKGYRVQHESARIYFDQQLALGKSMQEIRADEATFQRIVLEMKINFENKLPQDQLILLDRGIPDSIAYYEIAGLSTTDHFLQNAVNNSSYKKVFLLELLPFEEDYARTDAKDADRIQALLLKYYKEAGFSVIDVPVMPIEERANFILNHLE